MSVSPSPSVILALETSCPHASLSLSVDGEILFSREWEAERSHNSRIFDILKEAKVLLEEFPPDLILVGSGPGSYSGVRVSLAAADGLALVYGSRVVAVPSWEALPVMKDKSLVLSDARRGGWAIALLDKGVMSDGLRIVTPEEVGDIAARVLEEDGELLSCEEEEKIKAKGWSGFRTGLIPSAGKIIEAWNRKDSSNQGALINTPPSPLYVRDPHITEAKRALWEKGRRDGKKMD